MLAKPCTSAYSKTDTVPKTLGRNEQDRLKMTRQRELKEMFAWQNSPFSHYCRGAVMSPVSWLNLRLFLPLHPDFSELGSLEIWASCGWFVLFVSFIHFLYMKLYFFWTTISTNFLLYWVWPLTPHLHTRNYMYHEWNAVFSGTECNGYLRVCR